MLSLFFTIIFIAEVIIALQLICLIRKADKVIVALNSQVSEYSPKIKNAILDVRIIINKALLGVYNLAEIIDRQKNKAKKSIIKNILTTLLFFMLSSNGKQIFTTIDLIFTALEFLDKTNKRKNA